MYSVILMAALTTNTADAPTFHKKGGGCYGGIGLHSGNRVDMQWTFTFAHDGAATRLAAEAELQPKARCG